MEKKNKKSIFKVIFNIIIALMIVLIFAFLCLSENGLADLWKNVRDFKIEWILAGVMCQIANLCIDYYLTYRFVKHYHNDYKLWKAVKTTAIGQFFSAVTPGASGGQPMQVYTLTTQGVSSGIATSALMQKFVVYQVVLTLYSAVTLLLRFDYFSGTLGSIMKNLALFGFLIQATIIGILLLFSFNKKITKKLIVFVFNLLAKLRIVKNPEKKIVDLENQLEVFHKSNKALYKDKTLLLESYVVTVIQLTSMFLIPYCVYRSFGFYGASAIDMICSESFTMMVSYFTPLPGASGASEGASYVFFSSLFSSQTIKSAILIKRILSYYLIILLTAPFSYISKQKKNKNAFDTNTQDL